MRYAPAMATVQEFWDVYRTATGSSAQLAGSFAFGDSPEMADELADLVVHGPKRATAGMLAEFEHDGEPVPDAGFHWVVLNGRGEPVCVIRTTEVQIKALKLVDEAFAWDEGEGDRTLDWWRRAHDRYFSRRCRELGMPFSDDLTVVFERFELLWPR